MNTPRVSGSGGGSARMDEDILIADPVDGGDDKKRTGPA